MKREKGREELKNRDSRFIKKEKEKKKETRGREGKKGQIWGAVAAGTR